MSKISIVIATFNAKKYISHCLNSVFDQTFQDFKVVIVDNASTDETIEIIKKNYGSQIINHKLKLIENKKNLGFCGGYNSGIREVIEDSEYILLLNQDIILEKNYLEEIIKFLEIHSKAGAVMGKLYRWDFDKNEKTNIIDCAGITMFKNRRAIEIGQGEEDKGQYDQIKKIFGVTCACAVFNSQALKEIGIKKTYNPTGLYDDEINNIEYLDEDFFAYKEDIDISLRLRLYGWSCFYLPQAKAYHDRTAKREKSLSDVSAAFNRKTKSKLINYLSYKNHLLMLIKNELLSNFILHFPWIFFYELKKFVYLLFFEFSTFKALFKFFQQLPRILKKRKIIVSHRKINAREMRKWME
ncbi:glycosyltransferase family 2 protein [Candidatus Kuenenbacteria bacterium]|nr:glycosyltransferase family 2 protein [Candidatus Kuenenbacteria bacterium]